LQPSVRDKGLQIAVDYDLFMPTMYSGDAGRIRQVLTNLVGNAIKFTEEGHVLIRVVGLPGENETDYQVHITVEDTGIGIPAEKIESVFKEFQQVENDQDRAHDGTGLGLAITKRLVEAMGGEVWLDSREGVGSGFGFRLPLSATVDVEPGELTAPPWLERAFIVEQSGMNRTVLAKQLGLIGLSPVLVDNFDDLANECPGPKDLIVVGQSSGGEDPFVIAAALKVQFKPAGLFKIVVGPTKVPEDMAFDRLLPRPVLRAAMMEGLSDLRPPLSVTGEDDDKDAPLRSPPAPRIEIEPVADVAAPAEPDVTTDAEMPVALHSDDSEPEVLDESGPRRMRVLAAEDNRTNRFVFEKMLKALDIDLVFAENGLEAIKAFEAERPDIIFTDISMPKMDGKEATRRIRAIEAERGLDPCPIIAVTAHAMEGDEESILAAGIDAYLTKPLKKQKLIDHILTAQPLDALPCLPMPSEPVPVPEVAQQAALQGV